MLNWIYVIQFQWNSNLDKDSFVKQMYLEKAFVKIFHSLMYHWYQMLKLHVVINRNYANGITGDE